MVKAGKFSGLGGRLGWSRACALALAILFGIDLVYGIVQQVAAPADKDFVSFWAAGQLARAGAPLGAYDLSHHLAVEQSVANMRGKLLPFPYPPTFLLFVVPFSFSPYWIAFGAWVIATAALYLFALRRLLPLPWSTMHPAAHINLLIGQNGLLTTGLFVLGTSQIAKRPYFAGALLGLMSFKPQLCILMPVALLAGREWRVIAGALASASLMVAASGLIFGWDSFAAFFDIIPRYGEFMRASSWPWSRLASVFAFARALGVPETPALVLQGMAAVGAAAITWRAWALRLDTRVPILAAATLLVSPYLFNYDTLLLVVPLAWLVARPSLRWVLLVVWACCVVPLAAYADLYSGPNTVPVAALLCLWALHRRGFEKKADRLTRAPAPPALS